MTTKAARIKSDSAPRTIVFVESPAGVVGVDERVDEQRQAGRDRHGAADVEGALGGLVVALGQQARGEQRGGDADRHVDEQDPLPAQVLGQHAAEQHARGAARAGDGAPDAQRAVALGALGEGVGHDRQRGGGDQRGAEALQGARADEPDVGLGQAAEQRREREDDEADHEELAAAQEVGEAAAEQQEATEGEGVGVDDPGEVVLGEVERAPDGGQRDVDDGGIEDDDELRHGQERQREVLRAGGVYGGHEFQSSLRVSGSRTASHHLAGRCGAYQERLSGT